MFARKAKTAPSHYPHLPFHAFRAFQLLASLIVAGIMAYFTYHLRHDHYSEPWTFIWLFSASLASIAALCFTIFLHCLLGLNPRLNIAINACLALLWALSFALLTWYMAGTLGETCNAENWNEDVGVMVCRIYKALWTFTLVGLASTLGALFLDIYVHRAQTSRGVYHDLDVKNGSRQNATRGPYTEDGVQEGPYSHGGLAAPRESDVWEEPRPSTGPYNEQSDSSMQPLSYSYDPSTRQYSGQISDGAVYGKYDTGYHGGHA